MATLLLPPLEIPADIDSWLRDWRYAVKSLNDILALSESALRSRLSSDQQILELVDSFFDIFPKNWRKDEALSMILNGTLQTDRAEEIRAVFVELYTNVLVLFLKLVREVRKQVFVGKGNLQKSIFFDLNRLFRAIMIFKTSNRDAIENIVIEAFGAKQFTEEDVEQFIKTLKNELFELNNGIEFCENSVNKTEGILVKCLVGFEGLTTVSTLFLHHCALQTIFCDFLDTVAIFVENLEEHYCIEQMLNMSTDSCKTFRILLTLVDNVIASAYALFHTVINCVTSADQLYTVIVSSLQYKRFIFYYNITYPVNEVLDKFDEEQKVYITTNLEHIRKDCTTHVLERLKKRGMLVGLGSSNNPEVQDQIDYVAELLPHFSPQFIHLCLRHFDYRAEQTANALLTINELPLDLQALMSVELKAENAPACIAGSSHFNDSMVLDDEICNGISRTHRRELPDLSHPVICMKPPQLSTNKQDVEPVSIARNVTGSKIDLKAEFGIEEFLMGRKIAAQTKNKSLFTETFDVPNSEKVALRPTYERYRYVETTPLEYNLYDDEYDDTYDDQCQNYDLDFRNGDTVFEEAEIEPNTNRIPVNNEVDEDAKSEEMKKIGEINAGRNQHLKNNRRMMNTTTPAGKSQNNIRTKKARDVGHSSKTDPNERPKPGYTGGRGRQLKERHKGQLRRQQTDKKLHGAMY